MARVDDRVGLLMLYRVFFKTDKREYCLALRWKLILSEGVVKSDGNSSTVSGCLIGSFECVENKMNATLIMMRGRRAGIVISLPRKGITITPSCSITVDKLRNRLLKNRMTESQ